MIKEMVKGEKEKMLERNLYIHNRGEWNDVASGRGCNRYGSLVGLRRQVHSELGKIRKECEERM